VELQIEEYLASFVLNHFNCRGPMASKELMPHFEETNEGAELSYQDPSL